MTSTNFYIFLTDLLIFIGVLDRNLVPNGIDYVIYILFILISLFIFKIKLTLPSKYFIACFCLLIIVIINSLLSKYTPSTYLVIFSIFLSFLPFLQFTISYSYNITKKGLEKVLSSVFFTILLILILAFGETVINAGINTGIKTQVFGGGFVASLANQAFIIALYKSYFNRERRELFRKFTYIVPFFIIWTLQLKALAGMFIIISLCYLIYTNGKLKHIILLLILSLPILIILSQIPALSTKTDTYQDIYLSDDNNGVARVALYVTSFELAKDLFPFGSGPGTYGTPAVNIEESKVYSDYGISEIWGLSDNDSVNFKLDVQWASSLGELGVIGFTVFLYLYFFPIHLKYRKSKNRNKGFHFFILSSLTVVFIESIPLTIASRISFIMIYSGISAIMLRLSQSYNPKVNFISLRKKTTNANSR